VSDRCGGLTVSLRSKPYWPLFTMPSTVGVPPIVPPQDQPASLDLFLPVARPEDRPAGNFAQRIGGAKHRRNREFESLSVLVPVDTEPELKEWEIRAGRACGIQSCCRIRTLLSRQIMDLPPNGRTRSHVTAIASERNTLITVGYSNSTTKDSAGVSNSSSFFPGDRNRALPTPSQLTTPDRDLATGQSADNS